MIARALLVVALASACKEEPSKPPPAPTAPMPSDASLAAPDAAASTIEPLLRELAELEARIDRATVDVGKAKSKAEADEALARVEALRDEKQALERRIYDARRAR